MTLEWLHDSQMQDRREPAEMHVNGDSLSINRALVA